MSTELKLEILWSDDQAQCVELNGETFLPLRRVNEMVANAARNSYNNGYVRGYEKGKPS